jgi:hypothetical protein
MSVPGFFTRGVTFELPHPPIDLRLILIAHAAVECGLGLLRDAPPEGFELRNAGEDDITRQLQWVVENRLRRTKEVRGFNKRLFGKVWRAPEVTNFNWQHPAKKPDLVFDLNRDSLPVLGTHDALFVECKPVDNAHPAGEDYCDRGLRRFVNGDYAWAMQEAMMVGYVSDGRSIAESLVPTLALRRKALGIVVDLAPVDRSRSSKRAEVLQVTTHGRDFLWPDGRGPACPIRIFHSWHTCE